MQTLLDVKIDQIMANPYQPRTVFDKDALQELSQSIRGNGIIQPIVVRPSLNGKYEIVAGERRFKAACLAGYKSVPCLVENYDNQQSAQVALIENVQRENLTAIEEAEAYRTLIEMTGMTQSQLALRVGKTQSTIANKMRLLRLPDNVKEAIRERKLTERHARAVLSVEDPKVMNEITKEIIEGKLTVSETEKIVQKKKPKKAKTTTRVITQNVRIAINTIHQAVQMILKTGIKLEMDEKEEDEHYVITLKIQKVKK